MHPLRHSSRKVCCWAVAAIGLILAGEIEAQDRLVLNMGFDPDHVQAVFQTRVAREAFRRIGLEVDFVHVPAERALLNVDQGIDDGNLIRIAGLSRSYPNLIQVPEKFIDYDFIAFSKNPGITIDGWDDLGTYHVGIVRGWKILETHVTAAGSLVKVHDDRQLFAMLQHDRVDVIVYERWQGLQFAHELGLKELKILEPPLVSEAMFMYLNRKHRDIVPRLVLVLREMKEDGTYQHIVDEVFSPFY